MSIRKMVSAERADVVAFLRTLSPEDWEAESLCTGWRVRDVVGHLLYDLVPPHRYLAASARHLGNVDAINGHFVDRARELSTDQLVDKLESSVHSGAFAAFAPRYALADVLVHHQDIRRPLGKPRTIDPARLHVVLDSPDIFARPSKWTRGLRFVAADIDWSRGKGPDVRGSGEALALAMVGRSVVLDELEGEGVAVLAGRMQR